MKGIEPKSSGKITTLDLPLLRSVASDHFRSTMDSKLKTFPLRLLVRACNMIAFGSDLLNEATTVYYSLFSLPSSSAPLAVFLAR